LVFYVSFDPLELILELGPVLPSFFEAALKDVILSRFIFLEEVSDALHVLIIYVHYSLPFLIVEPIKSA